MDNQVLAFCYNWNKLNQDQKIKLENNLSIKFNIMKEKLKELVNSETELKFKEEILPKIKSIDIDQLVFSSYNTQKKIEKFDELCEITEKIDSKHFNLSSFDINKKIFANEDELLRYLETLLRIEKPEFQNIKKEINTTILNLIIKKQLPPISDPEKIITEKKSTSLEKPLIVEENKPFDIKIDEKTIKNLIETKEDLGKEIKTKTTTIEPEIIKPQNDNTIENKVKELDKIKESEKELINFKNNLQTQLDENSNLILSFLSELNID